MELSNFQVEKVEGESFDKMVHATVDVTTGFLWWKKTVTHKIARQLARHWFFVETGKWTPGYVVDALERGWRAKNGPTI